ncbi:MAG: hypothetical protein ACFCUQ_13240 [Kiloniellales bacterium]
MSKKLLAGVSAFALALGLTFAQAYANPWVKNADDVDVDIDIDIEDIEDNQDVAIESFNTVVVSENELDQDLDADDIDFEDDVDTGDVDFDGDVQQNAAGVFSTVNNTGLFNNNAAQAAVAAEGNVNIN